MSLQVSLKQSRRWVFSDGVAAATRERVPTVRQFLPYEHRFQTVFGTAAIMAENKSEFRDESGISHSVGDLVLVKWNDGMVYFAKIKRIDNRLRKCVVVFDDKSTDEADFSQIHSGKSASPC